MGKILAIFLAILLCLAGFAFFWTGEQTPEKQSPVIEESVESKTLIREQRREIPAPSKKVVNTYNLEGDLPSLNESDEILFKHLSLLLSSVKISLLKDEQFIRKLVLQVDNAAKGLLVYQHSPFNSSGAAISVIEISGESSGERLVENIEKSPGSLYINKDSYTRYNEYGDLAESVDPSLLVAFYRFYEPLLDDAYSELGYPEGSFRSTLIKAIDQALAAPIVEGEIELVQPEANYLYVDENLESLNMLQKQLLRMGPENAQKIQSALLRFKARIQ